MKRTLIYILTFITFSAYSQNYKIESNFKTGKTYQYTIKRSKIDSREPLSENFALVTEIKARFTKQDKGLKCVWKYGKTKAVGPEKLISQIGPEHNELYNIYRDFEIEILFDPNLGEIELLNYEEMKQNIQNSLLKVYNNKMTKIDSATMVLINQQLEPTYSTPEKLLSTYFPEIDLYFSLYSQEFTEGMAITSEYFYPNYFGGDSLPVVSEITVDSKDADILIIKNEEKTNQEEVNRIVKEMIEEMSKLGDDPIKEEELSNVTLNFNSKYLYFYNLKLKLINKVIFKKIIEVDGITQTEITEINLMK